jgi:hypothetical protein
MVSMVWNRNHHVDTINVTLYKCDILGSHREHPDCSLCVTRNRKYQCTWCLSTCVYSETCLETSSNECPKPRIDMVLKIVQIIFNLSNNVKLFFRLNLLVDQLKVVLWSLLKEVI